ncbi:hypothetical protein Sru01_01510 [Sphaerisporangium rufum]|uniref:DUF397 domain-containing protein n=1 Tax=Sphaerisporangium rufum TaxID=1381558 RepID=A0A919QW39_9ACTN|nr:DUF397 domain-containing protein [Sphaerisporangium rufum]GII75169.1 hypothetical protein Sru01_01510 [Sphaerisporangium rufum]
MAASPLSPYPGRKSSFSTENGNCVVVDIKQDQVEVWDSKDPDGPRLCFTPEEYVAFWQGVLNREFDPPARWATGQRVSGSGS